MQAVPGTGGAGPGEHRRPRGDLPLLDPHTGYFWRIVGIYLLSFLIVLVASQAASYGVSLITQGLVYAAPDAVIVLMALSTLLNSLVQAAILPFDSSVIALMYTDLRMRSEGLDVELRRAAGV